MHAVDLECQSLSFCRESNKMTIKIFFFLLSPHQQSWNEGFNLNFNHQSWLMLNNFKKIKHNDNIINI